MPKLQNVPTKIYLPLLKDNKLECNESHAQTFYFSYVLSTTNRLHRLLRIN